MAIADRPPRKPYVLSQYGTIYNVFTYKDFRRKGVATSLLNAILEEAKEIGLGFVDLLATEDGNPLYEQIGFWNIKHAIHEKRTYVVTFILTYIISIF